MAGNLQVSRGNNINYFILITILYMRYYYLYFRWRNQSTETLNKLSRATQEQCTGANIRSQAACLPCRILTKAEDRLGGEWGLLLNRFTALV